MSQQKQIPDDSFKKKKNTVLFDDYLVERLKDPEFKAGFEAEDAKLKRAVAEMKLKEKADKSYKK